MWGGVGEYAAVGVTTERQGLWCYLGDEPLPAGCEHVARSGQWLLCSHSLEREKERITQELAGPFCPTGRKTSLAGSPLGTTMSARRMVGWMY